MEGSRARRRACYRANGQTKTEKVQIKGYVYIFTYLSIYLFIYVLTYLFKYLMTRAT